MSIRSESEVHFEGQPCTATASSGPAPSGPAGGGVEARLAQLPNSLEVTYQSLGELEHFYEDIFEKEIYLRHGIELDDSACVLDVGANIGLFTLFVQARWPGSRVYAFEPAPPLFELLRRNAARYAPGAHLFPCGVSDTPGQAALTFYPKSSGMSSFHADAAEEREALRTLLLNEARHGVPGARALMEHTDEYLDERLRSLSFTCRLVTLAEILRQYRIERVDLLKVDVQKSELRVLEGLADDQWRRIRQIAIEIHDVDGRVAEIRRRLERHGFEIQVEQDELYRGSNLHNLYATRPRRLAAVAPPDAGTAARAQRAAAQRPPSRSRGWQLLPIAAGSEPALEAVTDDLAAYLGSSVPLVEAARALQLACPALEYRRILVCRDDDDAVAALAERDPRRVLSAVRGIRRRPVVFMFPGLGDHYPGMARDLYRSEPLFRDTVDRCCETLAPELGQDLRRVLYPEAAAQEEPAARIDLKRMLGRGGEARTGELASTVVAQPAVFVIEYALGRLWQSWGIEPQAMVGYSLGEYVAACLAGVLTLDEALALVAWRAQRIEVLPGGAMLAVSLSQEALGPLLGDGLSLSAVNGPEICVAAGPPEEVARLEAEVEQRGVSCRALETTHAFHSSMMRPLVEPFAERVARIELKPPLIPYLSNVTGSWITSREATDASYWAAHLVAPVRFADNLRQLWGEPQRIFLEVGPGQALGAWALQHPASASAADPLALASLRHVYEPHSDVSFLLRAVGRLWLAGVEPDWRGFYAGPDRRSLPLPRHLFAPAPGEPPETGARQLIRDRGPRPVVAYSAADEAPRNELEAALCEIWQELLDLRAVGLHAGFFELGGNSLLATRLLDRVCGLYGVEVSLRDLFGAPTVAELALVIGARQAAVQQNPRPAAGRPSAGEPGPDAGWEEGEL